MVVLVTRSEELLRMQPTRLREQCSQLSKALHSVHRSELGSDITCRTAAKHFKAIQSVRRYDCAEFAVIVD